MVRTCEVWAAGFDVLLFDGTFWPATILQLKLAIPSVQFWPVLTSPIGRPDSPNPLAYLPQFGTTLFPPLVS